MTKNSQPDSPLHPEIRTGYGTLHRAIVIDACIILLVVVSVFVSTTYFNLFEWTIDLIENNEPWYVAEWLLLGNVLLLGGVVFFARRYRELRTLVDERDQVLSALRQSQAMLELKHQSLQRASLSDPLTGLPNRAFLNCYLEKACSEEPVCEGAFTAIYYFDLDRFKLVNDSHGHQCGDELIRQVSRRIQNTLGIASGLPQQSVARTAVRLDGDEFVAVVRDVTNLEELRGLADRLLEALREPYYLNGAEVSSTSSIGVVTKTSAYDGQAHLLLGDADAAMYHAKQMGRGKVVFFERSMREHLQRRIRLHTELKNILARDELSLVYHPIVSLVTGRMQGVEALLRWNHPQLGPISPAEFIPVAEDSELIFDIGVWVLKTSLNQMAEWIDRFPQIVPDVISINVSRKQFSDPSLFEKFREIIQASVVPAARIQLEVTEDLHDDEIDRILRAMVAFKALGVKVAIDDFGTGTSTFSAIELFPIDTLKIDMSLVSEIVSSKGSAAIIHSLALLVRNLDVKLVAEGVENVQQVTVLQDLGCSYAQGYLFAKPLTAEELEARFEKPGFDCMTVKGTSNYAGLWSGRLQAFQQLELQ